MSERRRVDYLRNDLAPASGIFWLRLLDHVEQEIEKDPDFLTVAESHKTQELHRAHKALIETVSKLPDTILYDVEAVSPDVCRDEPAGVQ